MDLDVLHVQDIVLLIESTQNLHVLAGIFFCFGLIIELVLLVPGPQQVRVIENDRAHKSWVLILRGFHRIPLGFVGLVLGRWRERWLRTLLGRRGWSLV